VRGPELLPASPWGRQLPKAGSQRFIDNLLEGQALGLPGLFQESSNIIIEG
jgi:hypothetical protein